MERLLFYPKLEAAYRSLNLRENPDFDGEGPTIFDVGANKGQSVSFFKNLYPNSKVVAFEPSEKSFKSLAIFVKDNSYKDVSVFQIGIGDFHGKLDFFESCLDETSTFVLPNEDSKYFMTKRRLLFQKKQDSFHTVTAMITTLDRFIEEKQIYFVDVLKIDVEGFELEVLKGGRDALMKGKIRIIQLERHANDMRDDRHPIIHELLINSGYRQIQEFKHPFGEFYETLYQRGVS